MKGTSTIRALGAVDYSMKIEYENNNYCMHIIRICAACFEWYSVRSSIVGSIVTLFTGFTCIITAGSSDPVIRAMVLQEIVQLGRQINDALHFLC